MNNLFGCGHCGNTTIMVKDAEAQKTNLFPYEDYNGQYTEGEEHTIHRILSCPVCGGITLVRSYWNDEMENLDRTDYFRLGGVAG